MKDEDVRLLYSVSVSDIQNFKEQQWKVTNYVLLLLAAIYSLTQFSSDIHFVERFVLCALSIAIVIIGCLFTRRLHISIELRQSRLSHLRECLGTEFKNVWAAGKSECELCASKKDVLWLFWSAQIIFGLAVLYLIFRPVFIA